MDIQEEPIKTQNLPKKPRNWLKPHKQSINLPKLDYDTTYKNQKNKFSS